MGLRTLMGSSRPAFGNKRALRAHSSRKVSVSLHDDLPGAFNRCGYNASGKLAMEEDTLSLS